MTPTCLRKAFLTVLATTLVFAWSSQALAKRDRPGGGVQIVVYLIEASNGNPGVDPRIRGIVDQFEGAFRYSTYKLLSKIPMDLPVGSEEKLAVPDQRELSLSVQGFENRRVRLKVKIVEKPKSDRPREVLNTEFRIVEGGTILIGGYSYRDGKLILAISAR
jgi:hypothetical protein